MRLRLLVVCVAFAWLAALAVSCGQGATSCRTTADCAGSQVCLPNQTCAPQCTTPADCAADEKCSMGGGCVAVGGCGTDSDCLAPQTCWHDGACHERCSSANICPSGQACDRGGHCLPANADGGVRSCGGELFQSTRVESNFLLVLDRSGSMMEEVGGRAKWEASKEAVTRVTSRYDAQIRFGLELFTGPSRCAPGQILVPVADRTAAKIAAALPMIADGNMTPLGASLSVAGGAPELADPNRANHVLVITDGKENCGGTPIESVKALLAKGIKTYVVGFGGEVDPAMLGQMAEAGGSARAGSPAYYQADDSATLLAAIDAVAQGVMGCDFKLAKAPPDPSKIYVYVNGNLANRDPARANGWEYSASANRVTLYGSACDAVRGGPANSVSIVYGCPDDTLVEGGGSGGGRRDGGGGGAPDGTVFN